MNDENRKAMYAKRKRIKLTSSTDYIDAENSKEIQSYNSYNMRKKDFEKLPPLEKLNYISKVDMILNQYRENSWYSGHNEYKRMKKFSDWFYNKYGLSGTNEIQQWLKLKNPRAEERTEQGRKVMYGES